MPASQDSFLSIFEKTKYRPESGKFKREEFKKFLSNYTDFLSEFNIDKVKASCEDADWEKPFLLVAGDLSGIQDTVYTISSKGFEVATGAGEAAGR